LLGVKQDTLQQKDINNIKEHNSNNYNDLKKISEGEIK
jgi:hypothetical protein